jgi:hypothetical protein
MIALTERQCSRAACNTHFIMYKSYLHDANCQDGLQNVILDPGWILDRDRPSLSRNILGQDARSRVLRPAKPSALMQLRQLIGLTCFARLQQRHV